MKANTYQEIRAKLTAGLFCLLLILVIASECLAASIPVSKGVIDLRNNALDNSSIINLDGQWAFFWNEFVPPADISQRAFTEEQSITVPSSWVGSEKTGTTYPAFGYGTYYLRLLLDDTGPETLALRIRATGTAFDLFIDGVKYASAGRVGTSRETTSPEYNPQTIVFEKNHRKVISLVIHVANFHYNWGGIWFGLQLGEYSSIITEFQQIAFIKMLLLGVYFIMFIYHLLQYFMRKNDKLSFYFFLICLIIFVRYICADENLILSYAFIPFGVLIKLDYLTYYLLVPLFVKYVSSAFYEDMNRRIRQILVTIGFLFSLMVLVTPSWFFSKTLWIYQIFTLLACGYGLFCIVKALRNKREGSLILVAGLCVLFTAAVNDVLYTQEIIQTGVLVGYGFFVLVICMSVLINFRNIKAYYRVEELTQTLEERVKERTKELEVAFEEIKNLALVDVLTGLANRRKMMPLLEFEQKRIQREKIQFAIALIDIDNFKKVNDTYGHNCGDLVLKRVALALSENIRKQDQACRWGGEEFLILFPATGIDGALIVAENIRKAVESLVIEHENMELKITITIGLSISNPEISIDDLIKQADDALYKGKNSGKNRVISSCDQT